MKRIMAGVIAVVMFGLGACENKSPNAAEPPPQQVPQPPSPMSLPNGQPAPGAVPQVIQPPPPPPPPAE